MHINYISQIDDINAIFDKKKKKQSLFQNCNQ